MPNSYNVNNQPWGDRMKESLTVALIGFTLFFGAFPLLFLNEGHSVDRAQALEEGGRIVTSVNANHVIEDNDGRLIHLTGEATTNEVLTDFEVGVDATLMLKLRRVVEMYQWKESEESKLDRLLEDSTRTYSKIWSKHLIDSKHFEEEGHKNPADMPVSGETFTAQQVKLGEFTLSKGFVDKINSYSDLKIEESWRGQVLEKLNVTFGPQFENIYFKGEYFYLVENPKFHKIGDLRIKFQIVQPTTISVIAKQVGFRLAAYTTQVGESIELLEYGTVTAEEIFERATMSNVIETWSSRLTGFLMMFFGLFMVFSVLIVLASVVPFLGRFVEIATTITSFILAAVFSLITIAIAWLFYRPVLSVILIGIAIFFLFFLKFGRKKPPVAPEMGVPQQPIPQQMGSVIPQALVPQPMVVSQQQSVVPQQVLASMLVPQQQPVALQPMIVPQQAVALQPIVVLPQQVAQPTGMPHLSQNPDANALIQTGLAFESVVPQKI